MIYLKYIKLLFFNKLRMIKFLTFHNSTSVNNIIDSKISKFLFPLPPNQYQKKIIKRTRKNM